MPRSINFLHLSLKLERVLPSGVSVVTKPDTAAMGVAMGIIMAHDECRRRSHLPLINNSCIRVCNGHPHKTYCRAHRMADGTCAQVFGVVFKFRGLYCPATLSG